MMLLPIAVGIIAAVMSGSPFLDGLKGQYRAVIRCPGAAEINGGGDGWSERHVARIFLEGTGATALIPSKSADGSQVDGTVRMLDQVEADALAAVAGCSSGVSFALIGKDGQVKKTWTVTPKSADVFTIIDAMPMRQREIRNGL